MNWVQTIAIVFHVLFAAGIVGLVLLQRGRGADAGAGFGAGASGTVFGARGSASFLSRTTAVLAVMFIVTSLSLAYMGSRRPDAPSSVIDRVPDSTQPAPAAPTEMSGIPALPGSSEPVEAPANTPAPQDTTPSVTSPPVQTPPAQQ